MKKTTFVILICALFLLPAQANAQAAIIALIFGDKVASEDFNISMELGINYSTITHFETVERARETNFGIAGNLKLSNRLYLSPTVFFSSGRKISLSSYSLNSGNSALDQQFIDKPGEIELSYVDVNLPLFYQVKKVRIGLAPQISFLTHTHLQVESDLGSLGHDIASEVNNMDYGLISILSYELGKARKGKGLFIQFRYYQGLNDVFRAPVSAGNRNNYFSIHLSLPFISEELAQKKLEHN